MTNSIKKTLKFTCCNSKSKVNKAWKKSCNKRTRKFIKSILSKWDIDNKDLYLDNKWIDSNRNSPGDWKSKFYAEKDLDDKTLRKLKNK